MAFNFIIKDSGITIDMSMLQDLVQDNLAAIKPFIELFLTNVPPEVDKLLVLHHNNDWDNLAKTAHHIKSSLSIIQVDDLHIMALTVEQKAKAKVDPEIIEAILGIMKEKTKAAQLVLQNQLQLLA